VIPAASETSSSRCGSAAAAAGGGEVNTANDAACDITAIIPVADLT
jgi:hypothetical protein